MIHCADLIIHLHERGFIYDFIWSGSHFLWVQENRTLDAMELNILEYHGIVRPSVQDNSLIILGLEAAEYAIKGILIVHVQKAIPLSAKLRSLWPCGITRAPAGLPFS